MICVNERFERFKVFSIHRLESTKKASNMISSIVPIASDHGPDGSDRPIDSQRLDRLQSTEVAFVSNKLFTSGSLADPLPPSVLASQIEQGDSARLTKDSTGLPAHLSRMCATPLLSPEDERDLFQRMNYCKFRANALRSRLDRSPQLADELEAYLEKGLRTRNYLVQANTRLVMSIAKRFADHRNSFDDLLSQGINSLMNAVEKFDYSRGYRFSTYATCAVRRDLYRMVMCRQRDAQRFATGSGEHLDASPDSREPLSPSAQKEWKVMSSAVGEMLEELDEREKFIVSQRFGFDGAAKKPSYSRLGKKLGISKERVRQLANRAMEKLRESATDRRLERFA